MTSWKLYGLYLTNSTLLNFLVDVITATNVAITLFKIGEAFQKKIKHYKSFPEHAVSSFAALLRNVSYFGRRGIALRCVRQNMSSARMGYIWIPSCVPCLQLFRILTCAGYRKAQKKILQD